jgi:hypothetical protein
MQFFRGTGKAHVTPEAVEDAHLVKGDVAQFHSLTQVYGINQNN